jgi:antagonist of KipI
LDATRKDVGVKAIEVLDGGMLTTVQDLGRFGYQRYGVPTSGALDLFSHRAANRLVGNPDDAAGLEMTLIGPRLRFVAPVTIAVTGADLGARGDAVGVRGARPVLLGGALHLGEAARPVYGHAHTLRVVLGPQDDRFTPDGIRTFLSSSYSVSPQSDRMGYRLAGPVIQHLRGADIVSDGTPFGAVQVAGDGVPIVLLADRGTAGGYTKIATVIGPDIPRLAQAAPGDTVTFEAVSLAEAYEAVRRQESALASIGPRRVRVSRLKKIAAVVAAVAAESESRTPSKAEGREPDAV